MKEIAEAICKGLDVPVVSLSQVDAAEHFRPIAQFVGKDIKGFADLTQQALGGVLEGPGLIADISKMDYAV